MSPDAPTPALPAVAVRTYRLMRDASARDGHLYGVELAILDDLIGDLDDGVRLGGTDEVRARAADARDAAVVLRATLVAVDAALDAAADPAVGPAPDATADVPVSPT